MKALFPPHTHMHDLNTHSPPQHSWNRDQKEWLDEMLPKATGREALVEKKVAAREAKRAREESPDVDLMGRGEEDSFAAAKARCGGFWWVWLCVLLCVRLAMGVMLYMGLLWYMWYMTHTHTGRPGVQSGGRRTSLPSRSRYWMGRGCQVALT